MSRPPIAGFFFLLNPLPPAATRFPSEQFIEWDERAKIGIEWCD